MRLIDADAIHKFVEDKVAEGKDGWANGVSYEWAWTLTAVDMFPTIEAEPVKHGRWDKHGYCSNCGYWTPYCEDYNYCPKCGAKMDLED